MMLLPRTRRLRVLAVLALLGPAAIAARAHDFWLEPSTYRPAAGQRLAVRARVGMDFVGDPVPRDEDLLVRFEAVGSEGIQPVPGVPGADPAGIAQARGSGTVAIVYQSRGTVAEVPPDKLQLYVEQEGLATQLPAATLRSLAGRVVRDRFARSVKTLVVIPGGDGAGFDRVAGLPLELVPLDDPAALAKGGALRVRLLLDGQPAGGIRVAALPRLDPLHPVTATTDRRGEATLGLTRGGEWLVKAVRVRPAAPGSGVDLESLWASVTFRTEAP